MNASREKMTPVDVQVTWSEGKRLVFTEIISAQYLLIPLQESWVNAVNVKLSVFEKKMFFAQYLKLPFLIVTKFVGIWKKCSLLNIWNFQFW